MSYIPSDDLKLGVDIDAIGNKKTAIDGTLDLSAAVHARVLRKLDWYLLPLVSSLYFLSFL